MKPIDFRYLSPVNKKYDIQLIPVANGAVFIGLQMREQEKLRSANVLYLHVQKRSRKCYIGITVQVASKRWFTGTTYSQLQPFGRALNKYGWAEFESHILAFSEERRALEIAEIQAIAKAGGHKSKFLYNASPGGDVVADNQKPLVGVFLESGFVRQFDSGAAAARELGFKSSDTPMAVVRGEISNASGWWFRLASDRKSRPPKIWGEKLRKSRMKEINARPIVAINFDTRETRKFESMGLAAKALAIQQSEVSAVANGKSHSAKRWWFKFENDPRPMPGLYGGAAARKKRDKKVFAVNLLSGLRKVYRNCTVADNELKIYKGGAAMVAAGVRSSAAGWWFSYSEFAKPPTEFKGALVAKARSKPILVFDLSKKNTKKFPSAKTASIELGISRAAISKAIAKKATVLGRYKFKFI